MGGRGRMLNNGFFMLGRDIHDKNRLYTLLMLCSNDTTERKLKASLCYYLGSFSFVMTSKVEQLGERHPRVRVGSLGRDIFGCRLLQDE